MGKWFVYLSYSELINRPLDLLGNETISHAKENGRITLLFMAFNRAPKIVRIFGTGSSSGIPTCATEQILAASVIEFGTPEYDELLPPTTRLPGSRAIIVVDIYKVGTVGFLYLRS